MQHKLLLDNAGQRTFVVVLETGDEATPCLQSFITDQHIFTAQFTAIGAFSDVILKYFDSETKKDNFANEQVEVASLIGDVAASPPGKAALHAHLVVGERNGSAMAGHLGKAHVRPTLEIILTEGPAHLRKVTDAKSGLALIRADNDMKAFGRKVWAIPEGYIPSRSVSDAHDLVSHEAACFLNTGDREADIAITLFFKDSDPVGPYRLKVESKRAVHMHFNDLADPAPVPRDMSYASLIESTEPIIVQHTRLDSRQPGMAMLSAVAYSEGE